MTSGSALVHVVVRGRVQGVGYRAWCARTAEGLALRGWVRNRRDGSVEAVFAGPEAALEAVVEACRAGPSGARVDTLHRHEASESALMTAGGAHGFVVLATV